MTDNPSSDLELIFAEDFYARKFDKKMTSVLTDILRSAQEIIIDESYFRHPEEGAMAHNVNFDYSFLQAEFERLDLKLVRPFICTKVAMKKHSPGLASYSLKNLTQHFGISLETHHRALCDAEAVAGLLALINEKRASNSLTKDEST